MPAITIRLSDDQRDKLKLLALARRSSAQQIITDLLNREIAEHLGVAAPGAALARVQELLGVEATTISDADRDRADRLLAKAKAGLARRYGDADGDDRHGESAAA